MILEWRSYSVVVKDWFVKVKDKDLRVEDKDEDKDCKLILKDRRGQALPRGEQQTRSQ